MQKNKFPKDFLWGGAVEMYWLVLFEVEIIHLLNGTRKNKSGK